MKLVLRLSACLLLSSCVPATSVDAGGSPDGRPLDAQVADTGTSDGGPADAGDAGLLDGALADTGPADTGPADAGPIDVGVPDAGPQLCQANPQAECQVVQDCQPDLQPPSNCTPCRPYNRAVCSDGACLSPPVLDGGDIYTVVMTVAPNVLGVESFAVFAVSEHTAGNRKLTCEDFYSNRVSLDDDCLNVLETRSYTLPQTGDTYAVSFASFASSQRTLFVVNGHRGARPVGPALGVSCTEVDVAPPTGNGPYLFSGEPMVLLP